MPGYRVFGNIVLSFMTKLASGYWHLFDPQNGYTAIRTEVLRARAARPRGAALQLRERPAHPPQHPPGAGRRRARSRRSTATRSRASGSRKVDPRAAEPADPRVLAADLVSLRALVVLADRAAAVPRAVLFAVRARRRDLGVLPDRGVGRRHGGDRHARGAAAHARHADADQRAAARHPGEPVDPEICRRTRRRADPVSGRLHEVAQDVGPAATGVPRALLRPSGPAGSTAAARRRRSPASRPSGRTAFARAAVT